MYSILLYIIDSLTSLTYKAVNAVCYLTITSSIFAIPVID